MDILTQIQGYVNTIPQAMANNIRNVTDAKLTVGEAHAIAQLAETGFVGLKDVSSVAPPVPIDSLDGFRATADEAIDQARLIMQRAREVDALMAALPATFSTEEEQLKEMQELAKTYEEAAERLRRVENESEFYQQILRGKLEELGDDYQIHSDIKLADVV
jgi:hypothetical protein